MNKILIFLIPILIILILGSVAYSFFKFIQPTVEIKGHKFEVVIAKSEKDKQIGLSKYKTLSKDKGMIFLFDKPDFYAFWMKDMKFPIDIIFVRENRIATIYESLPINNLTTYSPTEASDKVLEINANLSKEYGFKVGDTVSLKNVK